MANVKISELPASGSVADGSLLAVVEGGVTKKATREEVIEPAQTAADDAQADATQALADAEAAHFPPIVTETGATLTLDITYRGKIIRCTNAAGCNITVPDDVFAAEDWVQAYGTQGLVTWTAGSGVTFNPASPQVSRAVYAPTGVLFDAVDHCVPYGDLQL